MLEVTRKDLQAALKIIKKQGLTKLDLRASSDRLSAEYERVTGVKVTVLKITTTKPEIDLLWSRKGDRIVFEPITDAGKAVWGELDKNPISAFQLPYVRNQLKRAGYFIRKDTRKVKPSSDITDSDLALLAELGVL